MSALVVAARSWQDVAHFGIFASTIAWVAWLRWGQR